MIFELDVEHGAPIPHTPHGLIQHAVPICSWMTIDGVMVVRLGYNLLDIIN